MVVLSVKSLFAPLTVSYRVLFLLQKANKKTKLWVYIKSFMHQKLDGDCKIWKKFFLVISKKNSNMFFVFKIEIMCNMFYGSGFADIQTFNPPNCARHLSQGRGIFWARRLITTGPILVSISWNSCSFFPLVLFTSASSISHVAPSKDLINCLLFTIFFMLA